MKPVAVVALLLLSAVSLRPPAQQRAQFSPRDLVGTWTLDAAEAELAESEARVLAAEMQIRVARAELNRAIGQTM